MEETAFVMCCYRSSNEALSGDPYARHWVTDEAMRWARGFLGVSSYEAQAHCQRNRYWLTCMKAFLERHPNGVIVNLGAGFSHYPFLLPQKHRYCDVDQAHVTALKSARQRAWQEDGTLPQRQLDYMTADFEDADLREDLFIRLQEWIGGQPCFILLEGVIFFLQENTARTLVEQLARLQQKGDQLGLVSFLPNIVNQPVYGRLLDFLAQELNTMNPDFTHLPTRYFQNLRGYDLLEHTEAGALSLRFCPDNIIGDPQEMLNEQMYLLQRSS